jgi:3-methyladenine DNA glycosylase AlkD
MQELDQLRALANPELAERIAARHKSGRQTLGLTPAQIEATVTAWRDSLDLDARVALARQLWESNIHEARIAAPRLLVQARIQDDETVWTALTDWAAAMDGVDITDAVMAATSRRIVAHPERMEDMLNWAQSSNPWLRRGALMATLPWAKMNNPKPEDVDIRERVLDWMLHLADDSNGAVRQAIETWLRDLAKRAPERVAEWRQTRGADVTGAVALQQDTAQPETTEPQADIQNDIEPVDQQDPSKPDQDL